VVNEMLAAYKESSARFVIPPYTDSALRKSNESLKIWGKQIPFPLDEAGRESGTSAYREAGRKNIMDEPFLKQKKTLAERKLPALQREQNRATTERPAYLKFPVGKRRVPGG